MSWTYFNKAVDRDLVCCRRLEQRRKKAKRKGLDQEAQVIEFSDLKGIIILHNV